MRLASRRVFLGGATLLSSGIFGEHPTLGQSRPPQHGAEPIRIGCITALTGPQEVLGRPMLDGARIAADQINAAGGVLGRPLEIVAADAHADASTAAALARQLGSSGIKLLSGCVTSDVALAISPLLVPGDALMISCAAASDKLTHEAFTPNYFRVTDQTYMRNRAQARLMAARYPDVASWGAVLPDTEYGRSAWASFHEGLLEAYPAAGQALDIHEPLLARFGETDFRQTIAALQRSGPGGLFVAIYGDDAINLYQQAERAGLLAKLKVLADSTNEFLVPLALGAATPEHLWLAMSWYFGGYQTLAMGKALYEDYVQRTGNGLPLGFLCTGHSAILAYAAAITDARSTETAAVRTALAGLRFDTAKGPVTLRKEDHQAICDVNFIRVRNSKTSLSMDINDGGRPDIEVAEFLRYDGASVIETPAPGKPLNLRFTPGQSPPAVQAATAKP